MKVYLAARFSRLPELNGYANELEAAGIQVTSRWLYGGHEWVGTPDDDIPRDELARFALEDLEDIDRADVMVCFTEPSRSGPARGGRHVEAGYALAKGMPIVVVGHIENVFYALPQITVVETWEEALEHLKTVPYGSSNLIRHARFELERAGMFDDDADYGGALGTVVMDLVKVFASQDHSGMSAAMTIGLFTKLVRFEPLTAITSDPDEWTHVFNDGDQPMWQNKRRSTSFSRDGGKTWYDIDDASLNNGDTWYSEEQTKDYLRDLGLPVDSPIVLDGPTKARLWDELYELQREWRQEQGLPDDGSVMFDPVFNKRLREQAAATGVTS